MAESIAERVAREWWQLWRPRIDSPLNAQISLHQRIQAAIDEAVLHNFTLGELVEVAVRAEREACANEARRGDNGHDPSDRIGQAILARSTK